MSPDIEVEENNGEYDADISLSLKSSIVPYRSITTKA
jgi:hypothetical protein